MRTALAKLDYTVLIDRLAESDGGGYLATVPELPGCMSDGATPEEAPGNMQEAIASWIESARDWKQEIPVGRQSPARHGNRHRMMLCLML